MDMNAIVSAKEVAEFIAEHDGLYGGRLSSQHNYPRVVSLAWLDKVLQENNFRNQDSVGVISGTVDELELKIIDAQSVSVISFDSNQSYDLDLDWTGLDWNRLIFHLRCAIKSWSMCLIRMLPSKTSFIALGQAALST